MRFMEMESLLDMFYIDQYLQYVLYYKTKCVSHVHPADIRGFLKLLCWPLQLPMVAQSHSLPLGVW